MGSRRAKYVFAASDTGHEADASTTTKVCPRCGQRLFADMRYCYGCLYDFEAPPSAAPDGLGAIELDEIDDLEGVGTETATEAVQEHASTGKHHKDHGEEVDDSLQDTMQLAVTPPSRDDAPKRHASARGRLALRVSAHALDFTLPIGGQGIHIGREQDNDVVLHSRLVSRSHAFIEEHAGTVMLKDLGATNPAKLRGKEVSGLEELEVGDVVEVCGTTLTLIELPA